MSDVVCIFGDSIAWGAVDPEEGGWVQRLKKYVESRLDEFEIYNLGISGDTSSGVLKRFDVETAVRKPQIIIFAIGTNDSAHIKTKDNNIVSLSNFLSNMQILIDKSKKITKKVFIIGLPKVNDKKTQPFPESSTGKSYLNINIQKYSNSLKELAKNNNVPFIDVFDVLSFDGLADGLHPNSSGHQMLYECVKRALFDYGILS